MFVRLRSAASAAARNPLERVPRVMGLGIMFRAFALQSAQSLVCRRHYASLLAPHVLLGNAAFPNVWGDVAPDRQIDGSLDAAERGARLRERCSKQSLLIEASSELDTASAGLSVEAQAEIRGLGAEAGKRLVHALLSRLASSAPQTDKSRASALGAAGGGTEQDLQEI